MLTLTLGTDNEDEEAIEIAEPTWATIFSWLQKLRPGTLPYIILTSSTGCFVQVIGSTFELSVEFSQSNESEKVSLVVLGRRALPSVEFVRIYTTDPSEAEMMGGVAVLRHEMLEITDAMVIFEWFFQYQTVPDAYLQRDISKQLESDLE
jgi:hypothetical protein